MIKETITCKTVSVYSDGLTRGKSYKVLGVNEEKQMVQIAGDNGRLRWFPQHIFNLDGSVVVKLLNWKFDDEVTEDPSETNWIEITLEMSDGSKRWCILFTPKRLINIFNQPDIDPPGMHIKHMIIIRSYTYEDVNRTLISLDEDDELFDATLPLE